MSMNQPTPEQIAQMQQTDPNQQGQQQQQPPQDPFGGQAMTGGHPDAATQDQMNQLTQIDPMEVLPDVILEYMSFAQEVKNDNQLDKTIKSKIMLEQSQAINYLLTHIVNQQQNNPQAQLMDMQIKAQQHAQDLQMKHEAHQTAIQQQQEKHAMEMQKMAHDLEMQKAKAQIDLINNQQKHEQQIVQQKEQHKTKQIQQKQAAQLKQSSNHSKNQK